MAMQTDVLSAHVDATGTMVSGRNRLKGYQCISGGTAGEIVFRDGGSGGTVRLTFNIGTGTQPIGLLIPDQGILFTTDIHVTLPASAKATIFYG